MSNTLVINPVTTETKLNLSNSRVPEQEPQSHAFSIIYKGCSSGLGIKIIGGIVSESGERYGIFVKRVLAGGLAAREGQLQAGDHILEVSGQSVRQATNEEAVQALRRASSVDLVELLVSRSLQDRAEFASLVEYYGTSFSSASSFADGASLASEPNSRPGTSQDFYPSTLPGQHLRSVSQTGDVMLDDQSVPFLTPQPSPVYGLGDNTGQLDYPPSTTVAPTPSGDRLSQLRHRGLVPAMTSTPQGQGQDHTGVGPSLTVGYALSASIEPSPVLAAPTSNGISHADGSLYGESVTEPSHMEPARRDQSRKLSLDPYVRLRVEKLEVALRYLGLTPTPEHQEELRRRLRIDNNGTVTYGEFVNAARDVFKVQLAERGISVGSMYFAANDVRDFTEPPAFQPHLSSLAEAPTGAEDSNEEVDSLRKEVHNLKALLAEKETSCAMAEEELLRVRREAQGAIQETRCLRSKVHLAEQAQHAARGMEHDYAEVIRLLEAEIIQLKGSSNKRLEGAAVQKRLAVLGCQLRKAETSKKRYEVATDKLLHFVETVHDTLATPSDMKAQRMGKSRTHTVQSLANEARETVKAVRTLIEDEPLPFGWDEAFTEDGLKYYVNHVTQVTTWCHPLSKMQHAKPKVVTPKARPPGQRSKTPTQPAAAKT